MRRKHLKTDNRTRPLPLAEQFSNSDEVAQRLRHLLAFHLQESVVHPNIRHQRRVEGAARLRNLVLMVRKHEIDAAAVNVESLAQVLPAHRRALDVPAGATRRCNPGR